MRNLSLSYCVCSLLLSAAPNVVADDGAPGPTDTAKIKITFTVPERLEATAFVATNKADSQGCLTPRDSSIFAVNAVVRDGVDWQLTPVASRPGQFATGLQGCESDLSVRFDIDANWYGENGIVTLLVSPL